MVKVMYYQIVKLSKFVAIIIMVISKSRASVILQGCHRIVSEMVTLLVLWAALHLQYIYQQVLS